MATMSATASSSHGHEQLVRGVIDNLRNLVPTSELKKISTQRDRSAGGNSSGDRVVAPTSLKSAGSPF